MKKYAILLIIFISITALCNEQQLIFSSFLGGDGEEGDYNWLKNFTVDESGTAAFAIHTMSQNFPVTKNAFDNSFNGGNSWGNEDIMLIKFNIEKNELIYSSYFGGQQGPDFVSELLSENGDMYIVGNTGSSDFPVSENCFDSSFNGPNFRHADGYLSKINSERMEYSTYIGSGGNEGMTDILINPRGEVIVVGSIEKPEDIPIDHNLSAEGEKNQPGVCILRFSPDLKTLLSTTFFGPGEANDAVIDDNGNIYIVGITSSDNFPVTDNAFCREYNGGKRDIFIAKISSAGDKIIFASYIGGSDDESYPGICLNQNNNIIIYGRTHSPDFKISENAIDRSFDGVSELFLTRISNDGSELLRSTFLGGEQNEKEFPGNITCSSNDDIIVCGSTDAKDHPTTLNAISSEIEGKHDLYITVFDPELERIKYSTFLGGRLEDRDPAIATDTNGNIIGICCTNSPDFPTTKDAYNERKNGGRDIALFKIVYLEKGK